MPSSSQGRGHSPVASRSRSPPPGPGSPDATSKATRRTGRRTTMTMHKSDNAPHQCQPSCDSLGAASAIVFNVEAEAEVFEVLRALDRAATTAAVGASDVDGGAKRPVVAETRSDNANGRTPTRRRPLQVLGGSEISRRENSGNRGVKAAAADGIRKKGSYSSIAEKMAKESGEGAPIDISSFSSVTPSPNVSSVTETTPILLNSSVSAVGMCVVVGIDEPDTSAAAESGPQTDSSDSAPSTSTDAVTTTTPPIDDNVYSDLAVCDPDYRAGLACGHVAVLAMIISCSTASTSAWRRMRRCRPPPRYVAVLLYPLAALALAVCIDAAARCLPLTSPLQQQPFSPTYYNHPMLLPLSAGLVKYGVKYPSSSSPSALLVGTTSSSATYSGIEHSSAEFIASPLLHAYGDTCPVPRLSTPTPQPKQTSITSPFTEPISTSGGKGVWNKVYSMLGWYASGSSSSSGYGGLCMDGVRSAGSRVLSAVLSPLPADQAVQALWET